MVPRNISPPFTHWFFRAIFQAKAGIFRHPSGPGRKPKPVVLHSRSTTRSTSSQLHHPEGKHNCVRISKFHQDRLSEGQWDIYLQRKHGQGGQEKQRSPDNRVWWVHPHWLRESWGGMRQRRFITSCHPLQAEDRSDGGRGRTWGKERAVNSRDQTSGYSCSEYRKEAIQGKHRQKSSSWLYCGCMLVMWPSCQDSGCWNRHPLQRSGKKHSLFNTKL